jgi:hypothetical protein
LLPVFSWLERKHPLDKANLLKARVDLVLTDATQCATFTIPEYAGGAFVPQAADPSPGLERTASLHVMCRLAAAHLVEWAVEIEEELRNQPPSPAPDLPTIWHHGDGAYSRDQANPFIVTPEEHNVLETFLESGRAMETRDIAHESGVKNVSRVIRGLREKYGGQFAEAIRTPPEGKKGKGGYFIRVRSASS